MTQIGLFCATGLSSALLVKALKEQLADEQHYQVKYLWWGMTMIF